MISHTHPRFWKLYEKLPPAIREQAKKQYRIFRNDPYHAGLHFKCVHSSHPIYSARITRDYRVVGVMNDNTIIWFWVGNHDDYENLLRQM